MLGDTHEMYSKVGRFTNEQYVAFREMDKILNTKVHLIGQQKQATGHFISRFEISPEIR
jgi:hypothetical protein